MLRSRGQTLVEYGLLLSLIAIVVIVTSIFLAPLISTIFEQEEASSSDSPQQQVQYNGQTYQLVEPDMVVIDGHLYELVESPSPENE